jgi:hypothetical protein
MKRVGVVLVACSFIVVCALIGVRAWYVGYAINTSAYSERLRLQIDAALETYCTTHLGVAKKLRNKIASIPVRGYIFYHPLPKQLSQPPRPRLLNHLHHFLHLAKLFESRFICYTSAPEPVAMRLLTSSVKAGAGQPKGDFAKTLRQRTSQLRNTKYAVWS